MNARIQLRLILPLAGVVGLSCSLCGCAVSGKKNSGMEGAVAAVPTSDQVAEATPVQAIEIDQGGVQGQTTWQIRPAVSVLPANKNSSDRASLVAPQIERRMQYAFDLAQRGAVYSAYAEFQSVITLCAAELDAADGGAARRTAALEGFIALEEVEEFSSSRSPLDSRDVEVARIAASHRTPLHEQIESESWDVEAATQAYYEFAIKRIEAACRDSAAAPNALYGMGRTAALLSDRGSHGTLRAMLFYDLALRVEPTHALAGNELGVLLAQNGRFQEAERVLAQAAAQGGSAESWKNLAVVYDRLGRPAESQLAMQQSRSFSQSEKPSDSTIASANSKHADAWSGISDSTTVAAKGTADEDPVGQSLATKSLRQNLLGLLRR